MLIEGAGLDRKTGLVHRIDPLLRACLPERAPTEQDVREALTFLLHEWLVDVALDDVGKCQAIMLAMTLIERALLTERPAFFVVAATAWRREDHLGQHDHAGRAGAPGGGCSLV